MMTDVYGKEKVDIYDELSNLNPFRINTNYKFSANKFDENYIKSKGATNTSWCERNFIKDT